ncbi:sodium-independent anion transporter [Longimonas halophila]|uniref:Sodium-independent anion transporter n=1 Tax=Longimonas halophila TaxID=1469170 RepID=A0A2H3NMD3_9BACT|nr:solute carrier family 26 protein [Longimonas halophila]PEN07868.1 sodium-independent anion transporter [Longimonas halophila]
MLARLRDALPLLDQLTQYSADHLKSDLSAGLTVGVMLIPQGMAYALIAGLPPIYGLYASLIPLLGYAIFGTSRQLAVGPVAIVSLLVAASVAPMAEGDPNRYIMLALTLTLMVGVLQLAMGLLRFGFLVNFLSHPVLSGFTSAAALVIGFSQLKHLLGVDIERSNYIHEILWAAAQQWEAIHLPTVMLGVVGIIILLMLKRWSKAIPGALVVVVLGTGAIWLFGGNQAGVSIVGEVPGGLPRFVIPAFSWADVQALIPGALTISLIGFMESIAVAKVYARRNGYSLDANKELVGLGVANMAGAFFQSYPTTGGFSRTAVNADAGAKTNVAGIISAVVIALTLLFLTPLFYYMPNAILASIVMVAVAGLVDWEEAMYLWRVDRRDLALMALTFVATLTLGIEEGILAGVIVSLVAIIYQSATPHTAIMGRLPDSTTYRNLKRSPNAITRADVMIVRMDAALYFANVSTFKDLVSEIDMNNDALRAIVIDMYPVNRVDSTAAHALHEIIAVCHENGIDLYLAGLKGPVHDVLSRAGVIHELGPQHLFHEVHAAVQAAEAAHRSDASGNGTASDTERSETERPAEVSS